MVDGRCRALLPEVCLINADYFLTSRLFYDLASVYRYFHRGYHRQSVPNSSLRIYLRNTHHIMGNSVSLEDELINLRLTSKQMQNASKKCDKNEKAAVNKVKKVR